MRRRPGKCVFLVAELHFNRALLVSPLLSLETDCKSTTHCMRQPLSRVLQCHECVTHPSERRWVNYEIAQTPRRKTCALFHLGRCRRSHAQSFCQERKRTPSLWSGPTQGLSFHCQPPSDHRRRYAECPEDGEKVMSFLVTSK